MQGFLKFARPEELTLRPVAPAELVDEVLKTLAVEADVTGVKLEAAVGAGRAADRSRSPASCGRRCSTWRRTPCRRCRSGGTLTIACAPTKDGRVEIRVSDTGVGIAPENLAKIFDLYYTTKQTGTGIGLSLVYRTVQLHNGDIDVESTPGAGTTFVIKMPKAGPGTPVEATTASLERESATARADERPTSRGTPTS